ncbi:MAG: pentapeptide repeat-containing protein [Anaerolineae bacterium]|nr:pentapeptide repeat-containing protein [Anaerolineae bacterium]
MLRREDHQANAQALRKLTRLHWLTDGTLHGVNLKGAHLNGADLCAANLRCARLSRASLTFARLRNADLSGARLREAKLTNADLSGARLQDARLCGADLSGADLTGTDLRGTLFDVQTILPDGTCWQAYTDLRLFTDPHYGSYWRSDDPVSPAYEVEVAG